jgi:hypothetical protein
VSLFPYAADRVQETTTTTGTGTLTLLGAVADFQSFATAYPSGATLTYCVTDNVTNWEVTQGTYSPSGLTLTRALTPLASSNAGALVNFSAGVKTVFFVVPGAWFTAIPPANIAPGASGQILTTSGGVTLWAASPTATVAQENVVYVATGGNDTTGNGSIEAPYATYAKAVTSIGSAATSTNNYAVAFSPGNYAQSILLAPWIWIAGFDISGTTALNGNVSLGSGFAGSSTVISGISSATVNGNVDLNFLGLGSTNGNAQFSNVVFEGTYSIEGNGDAANEVGLIACGFGNPVTAQDIQLNSDDSSFAGLTVTAPSFGSTINLSGGVNQGNLSVTGSAHAATVSSIGAALVGSLTLSGTNATYTASLSGVPTGSLTFSGGAATSQYVVLGELPIANLKPGSNGQVALTSGGVSTWGTAPAGTTTLTGGVTGTGTGTIATTVASVPASALPALTISQDVAASLAAGNFTATVEQARAGLVTWASGTGVQQWATGATFTIDQASTTSATGANSTWAPQTSSNSNATPGNAIINLGVESGTGTAAQVQCQRGGVPFFAITTAQTSSTPAQAEAIWIGPGAASQSSSNYTIQYYGGDLFLNNTSGVFVSIGNVPVTLTDLPGFAVFGGILQDFGGGTGMLAIGPGYPSAPVTIPTSLPTSFANLYNNAGSLELNIANSVLQFSSVSTAPRIAQASTTTATGASLTIAPQTSSNANATGGSVIVSLQTAAGTGSDALLEVTVGGTIEWQFGRYPGASSTGAVWCGLGGTAANTTNYLFGGNSAQAAYNSGAGSQINFQIQSTTYFSLTPSGLQFFDSTSQSLGSGVGVIGIAPATTLPSAAIATGVVTAVDATGIHFYEGATPTNFATLGIASSVSALWLNVHPAGIANSVLFSDGTNLVVNSPNGYVSLRVANTAGTLLHGDASGVQLFSDTEAFGGGVGVLGITYAIVNPTTNPSVADGMVMWANSSAFSAGNPALQARGSFGAVTTMAAGGSLAANTQAQAVDQVFGCCRTVSSSAATTILNYTTPSGISGILYITITARAVTSGEGVAVGNMASQQWQCGWQNIGGTVTVAGLSAITAGITTGGGGIFNPTLTTTVTGAQITFLVSGSASATIDNQLYAQILMC